MVGIVYGLLIILAGFCHGLGHIISSRMVGAPVSAVIETATVSVTYYDGDDELLPSRVHVGRALGGPVLNIAVGLLALGINAGVGSYFLGFFGVVSILFGLFTLLPIPSLDGAVILRELRNWRK